MSTWESDPEDICSMRSVGVESTSFTYVSTELYALAEAKNYYRWVISQFAPFLGKRVIEVGAGIGTFSRTLLTYTALSELILVEPGANLFPLLQQRFSGEPRVKVVHGYFEDLEISAPADSIVLVNVLEHIAADQALLDNAHKTLIPGGTLLLLVPAFSWMYGSLDEAFGHYRRYNKPSLTAKLQGAGFRIVHLAYLNVPGLIAWFLTGRVLRRKTLEPRYVRLYDRWIIPWLARMEGRWEPPFGQSLIAVARRVEPAGGGARHSREMRRTPMYTPSPAG
jgi:SAM-dependent methyltransferase